MGQALVELVVWLVPGLVPGNGLVGVGRGQVNRADVGNGYAQDMEVWKGTRFKERGFMGDRFDGRQSLRAFSGVREFLLA